MGDFSGETQYDKEFTEMFEGSAGRPSWVQPATRGRGPKQPVVRANSVRNGTTNVVQKWATRSHSVWDQRSPMVVHTSSAGIRDAAAGTGRLQSRPRAWASPRRGLTHR